MEWMIPVLGFVVVVGAILFFLMDQRWKRTLEEMKKDRSSEMAWGLM